MPPAFLALGASFSWGVADFLGGVASRRHGVLTVLAVSQAVGLAAVALWVVLALDAPPGASDIAPAVAGGFAVAVGLGALYRGLAIGAMGIVAPISAAAPLVPLVVAVAQGERPRGLQLAGASLALSGVAIASRQPGSGRGALAAGAPLGLVAALGFGWYFVGLDAAADGGVAWAVLIARATSTCAAVAVAVAVGAALVAAPKSLAAISTVGLLDVAATVLFGLAVTRGYLSISAVLASLYPAVTVALAWLVLKERLTLWQRLGGAAVLTGAALVVTG